MVWKKLKLGDCARIVSGSTAPKDNDFGSQGVPFIRAGHLDALCQGISISELPRIDDESAKTLKLVRVPKDTILFAKSGMSILKNRVYQTDEKAYIVNHLAGVICNEQLYPSYLKYFLIQYKPSKLSLDDSYPSIRLNDICNIKITLPLIDIQKKIATTLDKVQCLIDMRREQITKLDEFLQSLFLEMFGDPVKDDKRWEENNLGIYIKSIIAGSSYGGEEKEVLEEDELGVIKISAVTCGIFNPNEFKAVKKTLINKKIFSPLKGDLLFSRANTKELVGATCIVDRDYPYLFLPDKIWKIKLNEEKLNKIYLHFLLQNKNFKGILTKHATGTSGSMLNISMEKLRAIKIPRPTIELQNKFAQIVEKVEQQKELLRKSLGEMETLFQSIMQKAFRGELFQ